MVLEGGLGSDKADQAEAYRAFASHLAITGWLCCQLQGCEPGEGFGNDRRAASKSCPVLGSSSLGCSCVCMQSHLVLR